MSSNHASYRWIVLTVYVLAGIASQLIWITYAPVLSKSAEFYNVPENEISLFAAVFPIVYLVTSIPTGYYIDKYGFRKALLTGMVFLGTFALLRSLTASFILALVFQVIAGIGQPFVMNSISKLVRSWFPEEEAALATGLGTLSLMLGIIIALTLTPILSTRIGLAPTLKAYGIYSITVLVLVFLLVREPEYKRVMTERTGFGFNELKTVMKNRNIQVLSALFLLGVGSYTAFTTWVEPLVESTGVQSVKAGLTGSFLTIGGILGSIIIPFIADKIGSRIKPMMYALALSTLIWVAPYFAHGTMAVSIILFLAGFFFLSLAPLSLDLSAISVGIDYSGAANSVLWEFSQVGSIILIWLFEVVGETSGWISVYPLIGFVVLAMLLLSFTLEEQ